MDEEQYERQLAKAEQQLSKTERKLLANQTNERRQWFQTKKQREEEKLRLQVTPNDDMSKTLKKGKGSKRPVYGGDGEDGPPVKELKSKKKKPDAKPKTPEQLAKERALKEIEKVSLVRAKMSKLRQRASKLGAATEGSKHDHNAGLNNKQKSKRHGHSAFTNDLTDVSRSGALRLRSEANRHKKMTKLAAKKKISSVKLTNKSGQNKFNKGKNFGGPRFTKKEKRKRK